MNIKQTIFLSLILSFIINTTSTAAGLCTAPTIENITPGVYQAQIGFCYKLEGPTPSADRFIYTIRGYNEFTGCHPFVDKFTAFITTGSANGHPDIGDREIAPILKESYVYGFISGGSSSNPGTSSIDKSWDRNQLLGVRQSGNQLIVGVFSDDVNQAGHPIDFVNPVETAILSKINETTCDEVDPNRDGKANILDVVLLINYILNN